LFLILGKKNLMEVYLKPPERKLPMYFTDDSLLPENQAPLMITAAPYGPMWMPEDCTPEQKLPVTWEEQTQAAVDCYNAGATLLHIHVRDPKTGHISKNLKEYGEQVARLRKARAKDDPAGRRVHLLCARAGRGGKVPELRLASQAIRDRSKAGSGHDYLWHRPL
jgi:hypothetical protein